MSNRLSMAKLNSIEALSQSGHSNREISRLLGVDRGTVGKVVDRLNEQSAVIQNQPEAPPGRTKKSQTKTSHKRHREFGQLCGVGWPGTGPVNRLGDGRVRSKPATSTTGSELDGALQLRPAAGPESPVGKSQCKAFRKLILSKLDQGLSAPADSSRPQARARLSGELLQRAAVRCADRRESAASISPDGNGPG